MEGQIRFEYATYGFIIIIIIIIIIMSDADVAVFDTAWLSN